MEGLGVRMEMESQNGVWNCLSSSARRVTGYPRVPAGTRGSGRDGYCFWGTDRVRPGIKKLIEPGSDRVAKTAYPPSTITQSRC